MMKMLWAAALACSCTALAGGQAGEKSVYDFTVKDIDGSEVRLSKYRGDVLLIVNVASL